MNMAALNVFPVIVLVSVLLLLSPPPSSARLLSHHSHSSSSVATEPSLNIMLQPENNNDANTLIASDSPHIHSPCEGVSSFGSTHQADGKEFRKYGSIVLNMLPKGKVPPSAPSKGTNNINV